MGEGGLGWVAGFRTSEARIVVDRFLEEHLDGSFLQDLTVETIRREGD
jgi:hypothetical protein